MLRVNLFITSSSADPSLCCCCYFLFPRFFAAGLLFPETVGRHPRFRRDCGSRQREAKPNRRVGSREGPTPERIANNIRWLNRCQPPTNRGSPRRRAVCRPLTRLNEKLHAAPPGDVLQIRLHRMGGALMRGIKQRQKNRIACALLAKPQLNPVLHFVRQNDTVIPPLELTPPFILTTTTDT